MVSVLAGRLFFPLLLLAWQGQKNQQHLVSVLLLFRSFVSGPRKATVYKASSYFCVPLLGPTVPAITADVPSLEQCCARLSEMCLD